MKTLSKLIVKTFENNGFEQVMKDFVELCQRRQSESELLLGAIK